MSYYNFFDKILHKIFLGNLFLKKNFYELEKSLYHSKIANLKDHNHIFITGLPRSGTTIMLNYLYDTKEFASLTYEDMPYLMGPNLKKKFSKPNKKLLNNKERVHNDGIFYNLQSPEAFDEVFLSLYENENKFEEFLNYVNLILYSKQKKRYLSKNNLNYKRINIISKYFDNAKFFIMFRDPYNHSQSLLKQHNHFTKIHAANSFSKDYMGFLKHNEFGELHSPWNTPKDYKNNKTLDYWLEQWYFFYKDLFYRYKDTKNCYFICYESLVDSSYLDELNKICSIVSYKKYNFFQNKNLDLKIEKKKEISNLYELMKNNFKMK